MYKVLVIEDDEMLNAGICYNLQKADIYAEPVFTLEDANKAVHQTTFDLILLDINLPDGNGFKFAEKELKQGNIPFVFLTAHNLDDEIIEGFHLGADDYITKPFNVKILLERVLAVLRRCTEQTIQSIYRWGDLEVNFIDRTVTIKNEEISLTPTEFQLLQFFCNHKNQILTKEILLENIWDSKGNFVNEHTLTINISRLRSKIETQENSYIKTIYGMGYKWIGDGGQDE